MKVISGMTDEGCSKNSGGPEMTVKPIMKNAKEAQESEALNSIMFYPAERVHEIFARLAGARKTPREAAELRIFADRMEWLYKKQSLESAYFPETEDLICWAAYGEAAEDAARTEKAENEAAHA